MPHQCVRCGTFYDDGSGEILHGCQCGGRLFFYVKKDKLDEAKKLARDFNLSEKEKDEIENDVFELVGSDIDKDTPVVLDFESIRVLKPGQYELDLISLFKKEPLIFKLEEGKYMIDIAESFRAFTDKKKYGK